MSLPYNATMQNADEGRRWLSTEEAVKQTLIITMFCIVFKLKFLESTQIVVYKRGKMQEADWKAPEKKIALHP